MCGRPVYTCEMDIEGDPTYVSNVGRHHLQSVKTRSTHMERARSKMINRSVMPDSSLSISGSAVYDGERYTTARGMQRPVVPDLSAEVPLRSDRVHLPRPDRMHTPRV